MNELITMGETMMAMLPQDNGLLRFENNYRAKIAGAESNVAIGVSKLGHSTGWISKLGNDEFGKYILRELRAENVDCSQVKLDSEYRTGMMFKQIYGSDTSVFYYRENSAASNIRPEDIDEEYIKQGKIVHLTGITPVLSKSCEEAVDTVIYYAKKNNKLLSFDPNIRKKLWKNRDYTPKLKEILLRSDIIEIGLDEAECLLGTNNKSKIIDMILSNNSSAIIAIKDGAKGALVANSKEEYVIKPYACRCIETIGAGDAFNAGFLSGILENRDLSICGQMGAIAGAMATEVMGDVEGQPDKVTMDMKLNNMVEVYR